MIIHVNRFTLLTLIAFLPYSGFAEERPNIILMMADDIGYADIGCFGSEIETPNLDRLGNEGLRMTQFYNMSKCESTRSSLMTGQYLQSERSNKAIAFPTLLKDAGYYTAMTGKEHLAVWVPKALRARHVFDDSFVYWAINPFFIPPTGEFRHPFELNGKKIEVEDMLLTVEPFYKTDVVTNYALSFLDKAREQEKPFFLYIPYHSAHYPLQALPEDIAKYRGTYLKGWDKLREERYQRQLKMGIIPENAKLSPPEDNINRFRGPYRGNIYEYRKWDSLLDKEKDELDLEMAVYAAMIDRMDQNIGRVMEYLRAHDLEENTLIIFLVDNGSCPYDSNKDFSIPPGGPDSYRTLCAAWANAGNTPFRYYKQFGHEGGIRTPFIAYWPRTIEPAIDHQVGHVVDFYPTFLELTGAQYPEDREGARTPDLEGHSLLPVFKRKTRDQKEIVIGGFTDRFRSVRFGDWKIVKANNQAWQLYNLKEDPTELNDQAEKKPEMVADFVQRFEDWQAER